MPRARRTSQAWLPPFAILAVFLASASGSCSGEVGNPAAPAGSTPSTTTAVGGSAGSSTASTGGTSATGSGTTGSTTSGGGGVGHSGGAAPGGSSATGGSASAPLECDGTGPLDCSANSPASYECDGVNNTFQQQVNAAVASVRDANPSWFDYNAGPAPCCPLALQPTAFRDAVVAYINAHGLCAAPDPNHAERELAVKLNNDCNEGYLILTSNWIVRSPAHHSYTCVPAWL